MCVRYYACMCVVMTFSISILWMHVCLCVVNSPDIFYYIMHECDIFCLHIMDACVWGKKPFLADGNPFTTAINTVIRLSSCTTYILYEIQDINLHQPISYMRYRIYQPISYIIQDINLYQPTSYMRYRISTYNLHPI